MSQNSLLVRYAAPCAFAAAVLGFAYSTSFSLYLHSPSRGTAYADAILLVAGGLVSTAVFTVLYDRLREIDPVLALWGFLLALVGAFGAAIHGAYDLANLANPPASLASDLPSSVDPRGFGTFALTGLALAVIGALIVRSRGLRLPIGLGYLAFLAAVLLVYVYVGRLVILNPKSAGVLPFAVLAGFVVNPAWFVWLGVALSRRSPQQAR